MSTTTLATTQPKKEPMTVIYTAFGSDVEVKLSPAIIRNYLCKPTKQGIEASDADCVKFMLLCKASALNPFERDAFLVGYDGRNGPEFSMIVAQSAMLKRAEASPQNDGMESGVIVQDKDGVLQERTGDFHLPTDKLLGGWANVYRKDVSRPYKSRLRLESRKKDNQFWNSDPAGLIVKCAEADALRQAFPTKLGGLYIQGEEIPTERDVTPKVSAPRLFAPAPAPEPKEDIELKFNPVHTEPKPEPPTEPSPHDLLRDQMASDNVTIEDITAYARRMNMVKKGLNTIRDLTPTGAEEILANWQDVLEIAGNR